MVVGSDSSSGSGKIFRERWGKLVDKKRRKRKKKKEWEKNRRHRAG